MKNCNHKWKWITKNHRRCDFCRLNQETKDISEKCDLQIPSRFAIEMCNRGWILRNRLVWHKPNAMPSSVTDRFSVDYEDVLFFVKNKKYYFEQQYEKTITTEKQAKTKWKTRREKRGKGQSDGIYHNCTEAVPFGNYSENRNKRAVWEIPTQPFSGSHFATYPEKLCITPILAGCPASGIILDPFFGAGTTGLVANKLDRHFIGVELNPQYVKIAQERINAYNKQLKLF